MVIHKLATWVRDTRVEMAKIHLELNLHIEELQLRVQPLTLTEVREQNSTVVATTIAAVDSIV